MEPPVSIRADTLLYSNIFFPVEGEQPAAFNINEDLDLFGRFTEGSCQAQRTLETKKKTINRKCFLKVKDLISSNLFT
jgi:hypothetical protein